MTSGKGSDLFRKWVFSFSVVGGGGGGFFILGGSGGPFAPCPFAECWSGDLDPSWWLVEILVTTAILGWEVVKLDRLLCTENVKKI